MLSWKVFSVCFVLLYSQYCALARGWHDLHDLSWQAANMSDWYTESEVCVYQKATLEIPLNETYIRVCHANEAPHYPDKFGIGTGTMGRLSTKPCEPPFIGRRTHFEKELVGYPPARRTNLSELLLNLYEKNTSLLFLGDSITVQSFEAFKAEVLATNRFATVQRGINYVIDHRHSNTSTSHEVGMSAAMSAAYVYTRCYRDAPNDCVVVLLPNHPLMLVYFVWYSDRKTWPDSLPYLLKVTPYYSGLLVVVNHGLWTYVKTHQLQQQQIAQLAINGVSSKDIDNSTTLRSGGGVYTNSSENDTDGDTDGDTDVYPLSAHFDFNYTRYFLLQLRDVREQLLKGAGAGGPGSTDDGGGCKLHFVWRETTAGHFNSRFGYLDDLYAVESEADTCSKHHRQYHKGSKGKGKGGTVITAYDTPFILSVLRDYNLTDFITFVHFYHATLPLHNEHIGRPTGVHALDCVHFCWLPTLWQPLWVALAKVIATKF